MTTRIHKIAGKKARMRSVWCSLKTTIPKNIIIGKIADAAPNPMTTNHDNIRCGSMNGCLSYMKLRKQIKNELRSF